MKESLSATKKVVPEIPSCNLVGTTESYVFKGQVQKVDFLPNLPTSEYIRTGVPVTFKQHLNDIIKHYDIISMPKSFLRGLQLPEQGRFFLVEPENPDTWWSEQRSKYP
jgi:hypothetical protein